MIRKIVECANEECIRAGTLTSAWTQFEDGSAWCPQCTKGAEILLKKIFKVEDINDIKYDPALDERLNHG